MSEVELKFVADSEAARDIWKRAVKLGYASAEPPARVLESIYFDTPQRNLRKAGISLRLRKDGERWIQTVKYARRLKAGLSRAEEFEAQVPEKKIELEAIADRKAKAKVTEAIGEAELEPACWTLFNRAADRLTFPDGTEAELAQDIGLISAGDHSVDFCEIEIELIKGSVRPLYALAGELFPDGGLRFSRLSKAERGFLLAADGIIEPPVEPRNAKAANLKSGTTAGHALKAALGECAEQISLNIPVVQESNDPEGPHQMRVGLRRLRSLFLAFAPLLDQNQGRRIGASARWLFSEAGALRDIEAVSTDVVAPLARENPGDAGFEKLIEALSRQARSRRAKLRSLLADPRTQDFLLDLSLLGETLDEPRGTEEEVEARAKLLAAPLSEFAGKALDKRWHKTRKAASGIENLTLEQRHELRKQLKKLRYTAEFFASLYKKKPSRTFLSHLKSLQNSLGEILDVSVTDRLFAELGLAEERDPDLQRAIGYVMGAGRSRAERGWKDVAARWKQLEKDGAFWR